MQFNVKAVIFDMDGVITDTMPFHFRAWQEIFATCGIDVSHEDIYKREGQSGKESVRELCAEKGVAFSDTLAERLLKEKEERFKSIFKRQFIKGSRSFIKSLKKEEYVLGLVTGTSRHEAQKLLPPDLLECFDVSACGCEVINGKPHPEPYLNALKKLNLDPGHAVVFENAPFGIKAAKAAGITCLAIETSLPKEYLSEADAVFSSYDEIRNSVRFKKT